MINPSVVAMAMSTMRAGLEIESSFNYPPVFSDFVLENTIFLCTSHPGSFSTCPFQTHLAPFCVEIKQF